MGSAVYREAHRQELREQQREYAREHAPEQRLRVKLWKKANPEQRRLLQRRYYLKKHYGMTPAEVDAMSAAQGGRCAICSEIVELVVDHDHESGSVRGLLCDPCNRVLGVIDESRGRIYGMLAYLDYWKAKCQ